MFRNYFKISFRNLVKYKFYTIINVFGLALGLVAYLMVSSYITFEKNYDKQFTEFENIYRLTSDQVVDGEIRVRDAMSFYPSGPALEEELPEVVGHTTTFKFGPLVFTNNSDLLQEPLVLGVDQNFLDFFDYEVLYGSAAKLQEPNQLILTKSKALEYFNKENAVGEILFIHNDFNRSFNVAAIIEDIAPNTHYKFEMLMSIVSIKERLEEDGWSGFNYYTYLRLLPDTDVTKLRPQLSELSKKYIGSDTKLVLNLQALERIHLYSDFTYEPEVHGNARSVQILMFISLFILVIAWVNYINLSTAKAINRAKEVGLRKVIGANRWQLGTQFFLESVLINFIAAFVAYILCVLLAGLFNNLVGKEILVDIWKDTFFIQRLFIFFLIGTVISGAYPAMLMSGFDSVTVLKGKFRHSKKGVFLRKGLVVIQFAISILLISATLVVVTQVDYMRSKDKGMNINQVIGFGLPELEADSWKSALKKATNFEDELKKNSNVLSTAVLTNLPGGGSADINSSGAGVQLIGLTEVTEGTFYSLGIDEKTIPLLQMDLLAGRNFKKDFADDAQAVIVNEAFIENLGLQVNESLIGKRIRYGKDQSSIAYEIIGIVKDVNRTSLKSAIEPTAYFSDWGYGGGWGYGNMMVKIRPENMASSLDYINEKWRAFFPTAVLQYNFLDDRFAKLYAEEQRFGQVFGVFSVFAICIAILGLFGLAAFMTAQRTKEVGVRKVLGASIKQIVLLFYRDFVYLVAMATLISVPLLFFAMQQWLENYSYRIEFPWWTLLVALGLVMVLALITIGFQTYKVALLNPSKTLGNNAQN
ncbi:FtsX-like permease family protein [Croceitalea marina]|uniref:FtsX-like permease family protein n=1 Tax=Croceitalea marina TaxID=1775166 RepID=A0ABW5MU90_9FLAO